MKNFFGILTCAMLITALSVVCFANTHHFNKTKTYNNQFDDVTQQDWFYENIKDVYELGLMDGISDKEFDTESTLTVSQGITIASRLHSIYNEKAIEDTENPKQWYDKYILYATDNRIIRQNEFSDYNAVLKSYQFVSIMANALPAEYFNAINSVEKIPDVPDTLPYCGAVKMFYNAGILKGNDESGTFFPESSLTRKRAAAIIGRIALPQTREVFTLTPPQAVYSLQELQSIITSVTDKDALDDITVITIGNTEFTASEYMYFYTLLGDNYKGDELKEQVLQQLKLRAVISQLSVQKNIPLSYSYLQKFYSRYYLVKHQSADEYPALLALYGTTDRALCCDELMYQLYSEVTNVLFNEGKEELTDESVSEKAHSFYNEEMSKLSIVYSPTFHELPYITTTAE